MTEKDALDNMIRSTVREAVANAEPSVDVRDALLAAAARSNTLRSAVGPAMPPLAGGLCETAADTELEQAASSESDALLINHRPWLLLTAPLYAVR